MVARARNEVLGDKFLYLNGGRRRRGRGDVRGLVHLTLTVGWCLVAWVVGLLWVWVRGVGLLGWGRHLVWILALGRVRARGDASRGVVLGGRDLGFARSVTTVGDAGTELGSRLQECFLVASGVGESCEDEKGSPVGEKDEPVEPRKGLEGLQLAAVACQYD